jgi:hypothetical protein
MTSSGTELPTAPQGEDGAGRKPSRRGILVGAALAMLMVAGGIIALLQLGGDDGRARAGTTGNEAPVVEPASTVTDVEAEA